MAKRTDIHRDGAFVPADYSYVFSFNGGSSQGGMPVPSCGFDCELDRRVELADGTFRAGEHSSDGNCCIAALRAKGAKFAEYGGAGNCTACGAAFVYGDVWRHASGEHVFLGHICAAKFELVADRRAWELKLGRAKQAAATAIVRAEKAERRRAFLAEHEGLAEALEVAHPIISSIKARFVQWCSLSDKQIALVMKLQAEGDKPEPEEEKLVPAPIAENGKRQLVRGVVVSQKWNDFDQLKITVKCEHDGGVWLAWGTGASSLFDQIAEYGHDLRGCTVEFMAQLKQGRDPHFAIAGRPTKARVVELSGALDTIKTEREQDAAEDELAIAS